MAAGDDRIRIASGAPGIERLEAHLHGQAFSPHRHDTYAIGITLSGVQTFRFRGRRWHCLPGQCHVLHPDELHDGGAGDEAGFGYRMVYLDPALIQEALQTAALPFVAEPVLETLRLPPDTIAEIWDIDGELDAVARIGLVSAVAGLLAGAAPGTRRRAPDRIAFDRLSQVRELIASAPAVRRSMDELERASGLDRWALARQFRAAFGTSPSRFRTLRQLDQVRRLLERGARLVEAATEAGFADQSHMTRQFKMAYGLTPARWAASVRASMARTTAAMSSAPWPSATASPNSA
ncbi:AraC family transcriptional regulator [Luteimonas aquatica]|uniref:AraC family transcriptional regulator n=1 Tax=Luteimonas aquatica TaxID=450364 RepID=UPI003CE479FF